MQNKTKNSILLALLLFFLLLGWQTFAQGNLEIEYPEIFGTQRPETATTSLPVYLNYVHNLSLFLIGIFSFIILIWAGLKYLVSTGKPAKMADSKEQIKLAFLGLIIVFTSYLVLNTISPDLVLFHPSTLRIIHPVSVPPVQMRADFSLSFQEIPLGTMITSEIGPSSFISTSTGSVVGIADIDTSLISYSSSSSMVLSYSTVYQQTPSATTTSYQGALEGRRLKRIHEVASTTLPVVDTLKDLSEIFTQRMDDLMVDINQLHEYIEECSCSNCDNSSCPSDTTGDVGCCNPGDCGDCGKKDPCPHRDEMNDLRDSIPEDHYNDATDPIPCRMTILVYASDSLQTFLDSSSILKNDDYQDDSYWYSAEADELRIQIEDCIAEGQIGQDEYDNLEKMIDLMANVENMGTHSPKTDIPERDIGTNINHLRKQLNYLLDIKRVLNPHYNAQPLARTQFFESIKTRLESSYEEVSINIFSLVPEDLRAVNDPATFYRPPEFTIKDLPNVARAQAPLNCARIVEIPIGTTLDEAIKLVKLILKELQNIDNKSDLIIERINDPTPSTMNPSDFQSLQELIADTTNLLIDVSDETNIGKCDEVCEPECEVTNTYDCHCDADGNNCKTCCDCTCTCDGIYGGNPYPPEVTTNYNLISEYQSNIRSAYSNIESAINSIYESFYKLNSEYPEGHDKEGERVPIGEDTCCTNEEANCRDDDGNLVETEERDYTLIEKLVWIQKLLNRSRNFDDFKYLIERLGSLFAVEEEIDNILLQQTIGYTTIGGALDLTSCGMLYSDIAEYVKGEESLKFLENCQMAKYYGQIKLETCNLYDPPLDCDYFNSATTTQRTPLNCYCYEEVWYPNYPDIASNFFCCVTKQMEINE
ncbi:MAG: pilin [Patescibacteria group bacterium]|nr:pilin [Patescibacteria group bacterium]